MLTCSYHILYNNKHQTVHFGIHCSANFTNIPCSSWHGNFILVEVKTMWETAGGDWSLQMRQLLGNTNGLSNARILQVVIRNRAMTFYSKDDGMSHS